MQQPQFPRSDDRYTKSNRGSTNLASCVAATVFLLSIVAGAVAVYFFLFKPKPPKIAVDAVQFPAFSVTNGTVNFEFFQFVTVTNPNRDEFSHYDSSLQLVYSGEPMGLVFIPAGRIGGGGSQKMSAKFDVQKYPLPTPAKAVVSGGDGGLGFDNSNSFSNGGILAGNTMEIETRMKLVGRVRVLKVFTHKVDSGVRCGVIIEVTRGTVLGVHC
ncbi:Late embryogenesis abundant, LEA-14 [Olea europaea subsp. europaea]|uniref:Late embryogenesis abundant, LEA-14 n=1 Tax=Olea europaea subsp. europaea TaxID=158383 RepID=A0A8S0QDQ7_OLEEU|nr:Late embryogenesis abundant, LEA-14 [Olea europaea subsp. europaea]